MLDIKETELVFAFPEVDEEAILRIYFCLTDSPKERICIEGNSGSPLRLAKEGLFLMYLLPENARRDNPYYSIRPLHYPFAVLITVGGNNAITGLPSTS